MDYSLVQYIIMDTSKTHRVLILVVMDYSLVLNKLSNYGKVEIMS